MSSPKVIPYDIWDYISRFLGWDSYNRVEPEDAKAFYQICRSTWDIGLRDAYRTVACPSRFPDLFKRLLLEHQEGCHLRAGYVQTLVLQPERLFEQLPRPNVPKALPRNRPSRLESWNIFKRRRGIKQADSNINCTPNESGTESGPIPSVFDGMTGLHSLVLNSTPTQVGNPTGAYLSRNIRILDPVWRAVGANIRSLELTIPLESLRLSLPPENVPLPRLTDLTLDVRRSYLITPVEDILLYVTKPFMNQYAPQLTSLALKTLLKYDISIILESVDSMPRLQSFTFWSPYIPLLNAATFSGLVRVLSLTRAHLLHWDLRWLFERTSYSPSLQIEDNWWSHAAMRAPLPGLLSLTLNAPTGQSPPFYSGAIRFTRQYHSSLTSLSISIFSLTSSLLDMLLEGFKHANRLQSVDVTVDLPVFGAETLWKMAMTFPQLSTLALRAPVHPSFRRPGRYHWYESDPDRTIPARFAESFSNPTQTSVLARWELRVLTLDFFQLYPNCCRCDCWKALLDNLPNLKLLNNESRDTWAECTASDCRDWI